MSKGDILELLREHPFTHALSEEWLQKLASVASIRVFQAGEFLLREGRVVDAFYIIVSGYASVELYMPERGVLRLQTLGPGDVAGWSWTTPPYKSTFDIRAVDEVTTVALDAEQLREIMKEDCALGARILLRLLGVVAQRLNATRLQLVDMYASGGER